MNDEITQNMMKASTKLRSFINEPRGNETNYLLGSAFDDINRIDIKFSNLTESDFKKIRLSLLVMHLNILQSFDQYYIPNYKPGKKYILNLTPPVGAVDGPVFGPIDPTEIKNKKIRESYETDLAENSRLGKEIALQAELSALKLKLSMYDSEIGVISDAVNFIRNNYTNSNLDQTELERVINDLFHGSNREKEIFKSLH